MDNANELVRQMTIEELQKLSNRRDLPPRVGSHKLRGFHEEGAVMMLAARQELRRRVAQEDPRNG